MTTITVNKGDTLTAIARENGVSLAKLKEANPGLCQEAKNPRRDVGCNWIYAGDQVTIPGNEQPAATESSPFSLSTVADRALSGLRKLGDTATTAFHQTVQRFSTSAHAALATFSEGERQITLGEVTFAEGAPGPVTYSDDTGLFYDFANHQIEPDSQVAVTISGKTKTGQARELVRGELKRRGVYNPLFKTDFWLGVAANSELEKPTQVPVVPPQGHVAAPTARRAPARPAARAHVTRDNKPGKRPTAVAEAGKADDCHQGVGPNGIPRLPLNLLDCDYD